MPGVFSPNLISSSWLIPITHADVIPITHADMICITESWLCPDILESEILVPAWLPDNETRQTGMVEEGGGDHTDTTVKFVVKMQEAERIGFHKKFKLESSINT